MTILSAQKRSELIQKALKAAEEKSNTERIRIPWRTGEHIATVVELPVDSVILNPKSHRIRAQLESSELSEKIRTAPYSEEAQTEIEQLLKEAIQYDELKQYGDLRKNLQDVGQQEPGVVTAEGMLVNANTRCVALREIGESYIRVAVLPPDADQREIDRLELSFQMKKDFRSDYTFTNELLFVEDLIISHQFTDEQIAQEMGWASLSDKKNMAKMRDQVRQYLWMLAIIRELQEMSGKTLKLVRFDANRQALSDMYFAVQAIKKSDPEAAKELQHARLAAMLSEVGYRQLRYIDENFVSSYLISAMEDRSSLKPHIDLLTKTTPKGQTVMPLPGLDVLVTSQSLNGPREHSAQGLLETLTSSINKQEVVIGNSESGYTKLPRTTFQTELRGAIEDATSDVEIDRKEGNQLERPIEFTRKAIKLLRAAQNAYEDVCHRGDDFDLRKYKENITETAAITEEMKNAIAQKADDQ